MLNVLSLLILILGGSVSRAWLVGVTATEVADAGERGRTPRVVLESGCPVFWGLFLNLQNSNALLSSRFCLGFEIKWVGRVVGAIMGERVSFSICGIFQERLCI